VPIPDNRMRDYLIKRKRIDRFYKIVARSACYELIYELIRENLAARVVERGDKIVLFSSFFKIEGCQSRHCARFLNEKSIINVQQVNR